MLRVACRTVAVASGEGKCSVCAVNVEKERGHVLRAHFGTSPIICGNIAVSHFSIPQSRLLRRDSVANEIRNLGLHVG